MELAIMPLCDRSAPLGLPVVPEVYISTAFSSSSTGVGASDDSFGWSSSEDALGKRLQTGFGGRINPIIGVTKNFHYRGLQSEVEPLIMEFQPDIFRYITLSIDISNIKETLVFIESQWKILFPGKPYESFFLDTDFHLTTQKKHDNKSSEV